MRCPAVDLATGLCNESECDQDPLTTVRTWLWVVFDRVVSSVAHITRDRAGDRPKALAEFGTTPAAPCGTRSRGNQSDGFSESPVVEYGRETSA